MSTPSPTGLCEDMRLKEVREGGSAEAWLWWTNVPTLPGERLGVIGHFSAENEASASVLLKQAARVLREHRCTRAVGPMDGNTWQAYRFVTDPGTEPPFLLEPRNPPEWPAWWRKSGFSPLADYFSTASDEIANCDSRLAATAARMASAGIRIRPLNPATFDEELGRIYDVSVVSFEKNYLYTPLPREAFLHQYRAVQSFVRPELVMLAEQHGKPVGYVFALPDLAEAQRGLPVRTFIVKTLAVLPGRTYAGLGALLLGEAHRAAQILGFTRVIHALMHGSNSSRNLSAHYAKTIRRYTLFSQAL